MSDDLILPAGVKSGTKKLFMPPGSQSKRVTPKKKVAPQNLAQSPLANVVQSGDFRAVSCADPAHPIHILQFNGQAWQQLPDSNPVASAMISVLMGARPEPDEEE